DVVVVGLERVAAADDDREVDEAEELRELWVLFDPADQIVYVPSSVVDEDACASMQSGPHRRAELVPRLVADNAAFCLRPVLVWVVDQDGLQGLLACDRPADQSAAHQAATLRRAPELDGPCVVSERDVNEADVVADLPGLLL